MFIKILIGLVAIIALFLIYVAQQPSDFRIAREININASPEVIFAEVNDLHRFIVWDPWSKLDPQAKQSFEGPAAGVGAIYSWDGNKDVGAGRMTVLESQPSSLVKLKLEFLKPFEATNTAEFTFTSNGPQTKVIWAMSGKSPFISKIFCVFMNMDKMVGGMFEKGLGQLKVISEAAGK
jgi:hypothetical protein